jgi:phenylpropionate dioxygenase-like ring-hydroxylating dioxygenase large terminal subunit
MSNRYASLPIPFGWYCVAFSDELKPGEVKPLRYFGRDLVAFRTEAGEAKVLDAFCPHLGAHLGHGGKVQGDSIACPFHGWQFNGGGQCTKVPYAKNMPPKVAGGKQALHAYPVVECNQAVFAWYHPYNIEPTFDVEVLPEFSSADWMVNERRSWTFKSAQQEAGENGVDVAHFIFVHGAQGLPEGKTNWSGPVRRSEFELQVPKLQPDGSFDASGATTAQHLLTVVNGPGQSYNRFTGSVTTLLLGLSTPVEQDLMQLRFLFVQPKEMNDGQAMLASAAQLEVIRQVEQDIPIWEHKIYLENPTLCDGDGPIHQYRKWFRQFYAEIPPEPIRAVS